MTKVYIIFGKQGSGKTTQGERLAKILGIPYFESGDILRELSTHDTKEGHLIKETMLTGELVPDYIVRRIFDKFVEENNCAVTGFVSEGFPRTLVETGLLKELAEEYHWEIIGIDILISDQTAKDRLKHRLVVTDGKEAKRDDDKPRIIEERLESYRQNTAPVIDWIKLQYKMIEINGEPGLNEVTEEIKQKIND